MNRNRVKGKEKEIEGRVLRTVGKVTGSRKTQAKGVLRETQGKLQGAVGRVEEAGRRARAREYETGGEVVRVKTTRTTTVRKKRG